MREIIYTIYKNAKKKHEKRRQQNDLKIKISNKEIEKLRNIHNGKRCFIVGNGPSLTLKDLETLKNEITFASNRIYHIFHKTDWRPTYYCIQDFALIKKSYGEINKIQAEKRFVGYCDEREFSLLNDYIFIKLFLDSFYPDLPSFSSNIQDGIFEGFTVTYMCIQIAVYMGFSQIYLLGVDHNYSIERLPDGRIKRNMNVKDHFDDKDKIDNLPQIAKSTLAYESAKKYCDTHQIAIYNATRGGKLEVFDRIEFESIFL